MGGGGWGGKGDFALVLGGRAAQDGDVGVHHYCFLLGQRVGTGSVWMRLGTLGRCWDGDLGLGPVP
jgi:hypothetical protein